MMVKENRWKISSSSVLLSIYNKVYKFSHCHEMRKLFIFLKKVCEKFWCFGFLSYLCIRFRAKNSDGGTEERVL